MNNKLETDEILNTDLIRILCESASHSNLAARIPLATEPYFVQLVVNGPHHIPTGMQAKNVDMDWRVDAWDGDVWLLAMYLSDDELKELTRS